MVTMGTVLLDDGRTFTPVAARAIRQEWLTAEMNARVSSYSDSKLISLFCGTYNVNAKKEEGSLDDWVGPTQGKEWADIYVVGFQEIVDLNAMNVAIDGSKTASRSQFWIDKVAESLRKNKKGDRYVLVAQRALVGLLLCVFAKDSLTNSINDIRTASTAVGVMGVMGNKGGISCRFSIYDSSVCFVCSHLAAHRGNVAGRNADYASIVEKTMFATTKEGTWGDTNDVDGIDDDRTFLVRPLRGHERAKKMNMTILDHDLVFWLGDLNYRIDEGVSTAQVFELIKQKRLSDLAAHDQLNKIRDKGTAFQGFQEGDVSTFKPTYKYQPGTNVYDERNPNKIRAPAWCDRVLWRQRPSAGAIGKSSDAKGDKLCTEALPMGYYSVPSLLSSDHKPVRADFRVRCLRYLPEQEQATYTSLESSIRNYGSDLRALQSILGAQVTRSLTGETALSSPGSPGPRNVSVSASSLKLGPGQTLPVPEITLSDQLLEFPHARYHHFCSKRLVITNTGGTLAHWRVVSKVENSPLRLSKRWLHLTHTKGLLFPGEKITIGVHCFVDTLTAHRLNAGKEGLEDLLVVRVEGGIDHYVAIAGHYIRSSFGMSLQELVLTPSPAVQTLLPPARLQEEVVLNTPKTGNGRVDEGTGVGGADGDGDDLLAFVSPSSETGGEHVDVTTDKAISNKGGQNNAGGNKNPTVLSPSSSQGPPAGAYRMSIPKELWRLVDNLWSAGAGGALRERDLFASLDTLVLTRDVVLEVSLIRHALDNGSDLPSCSPHSIIVALAAFLVSLPKPLLPTELCPQTHVEASDLRPWCKAFLQSLPALHYNAFIYILSFLREVLGQRSYNRANPTILATFCVDTMTNFSPYFRWKQQLHFYHTLATAVGAGAGVGVGSGDEDLTIAMMEEVMGDSHSHSNLTFSGGGVSPSVASARADESLEGRRRALGAVMEYMLTVQHHL